MDTHILMNIQPIKPKALKTLNDTSLRNFGAKRAFEILEVNANV